MMKISLETGSAIKVGQLNCRPAFVILCNMKDQGGTFCKEVNILYKIPEMQTEPPQ